MKVVVFVSGGAVQSVITDTHNLEVMIVDYDIDEETGFTDIEGDDCNMFVEGDIDVDTVNQYFKQYNDTSDKIMEEYYKKCEEEDNKYKEENKNE